MVAGEVVINGYLIKRGDSVECDVDDRNEYVWRAVGRVLLCRLSRWYELFCESKEILEVDGDVKTRPNFYSHTHSQNRSVILFRMKWLNECDKSNRG